jgi:hypothetical protein
MRTIRSFAAKPLLPAVILSVSTLILAAWVSSPDAAEPTSPLVVAQAKADKAGKSEAPTKANPSGLGVGKGTECPPGKKATFVAARGKGAGTVECQ